MGVKQSIQKMRETADKYFKQDPNTTVDLTNRAVSEYNAWLKSESQRLDAQRRALDRELAEMKVLEQKVERLKGGLTSNADITAQHNALVKEHRMKYDAFKPKADAYDRAVKAFEAEQTRRSEQVDSNLDSAKKGIDASANWHKDGKSLDFFRKVNALYAKMHRKARHAELAQLRRIRRQMGEFMQRQHDGIENGMIIVEARLCDQEDAWFIVDTGASRVTIPITLVQILGLESRLGEEVAVSLAGGIQIKGRELVIPKLSVFGCAALNVDAIVIDPSSAGVDGLLGHSFLNHFDYRIDRSSSPKLRLNVAGAAKHAEADHPESEPTSTENRRGVPSLLGRKVRIPAQDATSTAVENEEQEKQEDRGSGPPRLFKKRGQV